MRKNHERLFWLGLVVAALGVAARQAYTLVEYPATKSGLICVGAPAPFDCEFPVVVAASVTVGPRPSSTATHTFNTSTPAPTRTVTPAPPLALINGDFESAWSSGWLRFDRWPDQPTFNDERGHPESRHGGAQSLRMFNEHRCYLAGVYQQVDVPQFATVRFSAWGRTWASYSSIFPSPSDLSVTDGIAVGIDERGGTNPAATGIVWVDADNTEVWRRVTVQGVALSNRITVFVQARLGAVGVNACQWPLPFMAAAGVAIEESAAAMASLPTATPTVEPPPTEATPDPYPMPTGYP